MEFKEHKTAESRIVEVVSDGILINDEQDLLDLTANIYYSYGSKKMILHREQLCEDFFDLPSGVAGALLQKVSNYRFQLAIVGKISDPGSSLKAFIRECNRQGQVVFVNDVEGALDKLL